MAYKSLREKSRYLGAHSIGANKTLKPEEITECENFADMYIEGRLGKSWASGSIPKIVEHIADLLGSSKAFDFLHSASSPKQSEYAKSLREQADELLDQITTGKLGVKLPDGTWDEDLTGDENREDKKRGKMEIIA